VNERAARWASSLVLVATAALVAAPWRGHVDDVDAQIYLVVARHMAADRTWFDLRYLPDLWPRFREHLPFGLWPAAAAIRFAGEWAVGPVYALFTLGTVAVACRVTAALAGRWAGVAAALVLGTCESIWQYGGRPLLDPPLLFFATAAAAAVLLPRPRFVPAACCAAIAVLIKGPFGLVPLASCALARALVERSPRLLANGAAASAGAALPAAAVLLWDRFAGAGTWWHGYLEAQLAASASGARSDGIGAWWFPLSVVAGRFWPGMALVPLALWRTRRDPTVRILMLAGALSVALLTLPHRKWGNHAYVVFPLLAVLCGAAAAPWAERLLARRVALSALGAAALAAWVASLAGAGRWVLQPPCIVSTEFAPALEAVPASAGVLVVSPRLELLTIAELAAERGYRPRPAAVLPDRPIPPVALARDGTLVPPAWQVVARARGWSLLRER
jgi:4-amino-4-deoxy-L-arabinose transferase-like glycosyltransferase